ncbi:MAG: nucleoside-diphosphate sugar epimerase [Halioglobus sp.]|nr:nucleoside-diphosphate sugar epimerase [Halioglobus sp.]
MPVIWLLDAYRAGERGQVRALVDALGWDSETKVLEYRKHVVLPHVLGQASLRGITRDSRAKLTAPWPDLVVTSGVRNEPVCRWIREQSGGKTRYVHVGRPWGPLDKFDLVVTTPQYRVPEHPNVLNNLLTLHSVTPEKLSAAKAEWASTFEDLPGPRFAVIVGGDSGPFTFGPKAGARLGVDASHMVQQHGGSLLVTSSSRSRPTALDALEQSITVPNAFYRFQQGDAANPYLGILAWADRLIVTGDSIAMLSEACSTGKPVMMFDLGGMRPGASVEARDFRLGGALYDVLMRWFWQRLSRDITLVHKRLREAGSAIWTDEVLSTARVPAESDLARTVRAVKALFGEV